MAEKDFREKFLKIGYSKRKGGKKESPGGRPYIGRKGIGKLALLSCADKISIKSKVKDSEYVGGMIDNAGLDKAIRDDMSASSYELSSYDDALFKPFDKKHAKGTIICFENLKSGISNADDFLKKTIALYFRFSLQDKDFRIYFNDEPVTVECLKSFAENTQFIWKIKDFRDPYLDLCTNVKEESSIKNMSEGIKGFIATVEKPSNRTIRGMNERVALDFFVNGRVRETDILKHLPALKARVPESYLYGQIHLDSLDSGDTEPFTTNREGIKLENEEFKGFLEELKTVLTKIIEQWDELREKHGKDGDPDNTRKTAKERKSGELANAVFKDYFPDNEMKKNSEVKEWVEELRGDANFNFESYADCFVSENLVRKYIKKKKKDGVLPTKLQERANGYREKEKENKAKGNVSIDIRRDADILSYLSLGDLVKLIDKKDLTKETKFKKDVDEYEPIRNGVAHTALLTDEAKLRLKSVYQNIKAKVRSLVTTDTSDPPAGS